MNNETLSKKINGAGIRELIVNINNNFARKSEVEEKVKNISVATDQKPGIVAVGDGINISTEGKISIDDHYAKKDFVNQQISQIPKFDIKVVEALPVSDISKTSVYLLKTGEEQDNLYTEYIYVNNAWEKLGSQKVNLSNYATNEKLEEVKNNVSGQINTINSSYNTLKGEVEKCVHADAIAQNYVKTSDYTDKINVLNTKFDSYVLKSEAFTKTAADNLYLGKQDAATYYVSKTGLQATVSDIDNKIATKANTNDVESTYAKKTDVPDVTPFLTKNDASLTYVSNTSYNSKVEELSNTLGAKANTEDVQKTYALKADLSRVEGLIKQSDNNVMTVSELDDLYNSIVK